jgi:hypothetical protein
MTEEQTDMVNQVAFEVFKDFVEDINEFDMTKAQEISFVGTCYGHLLSLAYLGYETDLIGQEAREAVDRLMSDLRSGEDE